VLLKDFQKDSVEAVMNGLRDGLRNGVYALADEVGLGKTLVCADVARRLIIESPRDGSYLIYYVAPSIELLDQNLKSIAAHLDNELGPGFKIHRVVSRLSKLPLELSRTEGSFQNVFLIGLSPETSFKVSGAGLKSEREYLMALFGFGGREEWKEKLRKIFWGTKNEVSPAFGAAPVGRHQFGLLYDWRMEPGGECADFIVRLRALASGEHDIAANRRLIGEIRKSIVNQLVSNRKALPQFVIFDEWHKYKETCFDPGSNAPGSGRLVARLLAAVRTAPSSKALFVSATPFTVSYHEVAAGSTAPASSDLKSLIQLFWPPEQFHNEYRKLEVKQQAFVGAISAMLSSSDANKMEEARQLARRCVKGYERELRRYCVRTERPRASLAPESAYRAAGWPDGMFASGSAREFIRQCRKIRKKPLLSPVTAMWMDGHTFPSADYKGLEGHGLTDLKGLHWKMRHLENMLQSSFAYSDKLHSFRRPPLWLYPEQPLQGRKHLIFSEFRFVPGEICKQLKQLGFGTTKGKSSGSILGFFPSLQGAARRATNAEQVASGIHFPFFYPFLCWELNSGELFQRICLHREVISSCINSNKTAVQMMLDIDRILVQDSPLAAVVPLRERTMDIRSPIAATPRFKEYLAALFFGDAALYAPGKAAAQLIGAHRAGAKKDKYEMAAIGLAEALFHMFVSPESQALQRVAHVPARTRIPRKWKALLRFSLWYCHQYRLGDTLTDFSSLLSPAAKDGGEILADIGAAISLHRGSVGTKFVRSFHDRKIDDAETAADGKNVTAVNVKSLRSAFNSPFPPYVLASTSVGQEGLDFHRYCDSIIHWTPPASPSAFRQRNGRLDRFRSLQVRRAWGPLANLEVQSVQSHRQLSPDFVVMSGEERVNRPQMQVLFLPFTAQHATWRRCLERMHYDDLLIGAPDPLADERAWLQAADEQGAELRSQRLMLLKEFSISLAPSKRRK
jgi:hypothetical protein